MKLKRFSVKAVQSTDIEEEVPTKKKRGRPKGSTNKTTSTPTPPVPGSKDATIESSPKKKRGRPAKRTNLTEEETQDLNNLLLWPLHMTQEESANRIEQFCPSFQGKQEYIKMLRGEPVTRLEAMKAKCYDCMGFFLDGKQDCLCKTCPLYPYFVCSSDTSQASKKKVNPKWLHTKEKEKEE